MYSRPGSPSPRPLKVPSPRRQGHVFPAGFSKPLYGPKSSPPRSQVLGAKVMYSRSDSPRPPQGPNPSPPRSCIPGQSIATPRHQGHVFPARISKAPSRPTQGPKSSPPRPCIPGPVIQVLAATVASLRNQGHVFPARFSKPSPPWSQLLAAMVMYS